MKHLLIISVLILTSINAQSAPLGEYFTYQGVLLDNGQPANGDYDISINLYQTQTGGNSLGGDLEIATAVNGLFSIELNIGSVPFMGDEIWIELGIRSTATGGAYTDLPRQKITNTPYAIHAPFVGMSGVDSDAIQSGAVTTFKLADDAVTQNKLSNNSVGSMQIISASVTTSIIADGAVTTVKIANDSINASNIIDGSVTENDLANNAVTTNHIVNATIVAAGIDNTSVQQRITGTCAIGERIRVIAASGAVTCEVDDTGTSGWGLTGNSGTNSTTNFIGTTDDQPLIFRTGNKKAMHIEKVTNSLNAESINLVFGADSNYINKFVGSRVESISILGGENNKIQTTDASSTAIRSVITGGFDNSIIDSDYASISGGSINSISFNGTNSIIAGGYRNVINKPNKYKP